VPLHGFDGPVQPQLAAESLKAAAIRPLVSSSAGAPWPAGPFSLWLRGPGANAVSRPY